MIFANAVGVSGDPDGDSALGGDVDVCDHSGRGGRPGGTESSRDGTGPAESEEGRCGGAVGDEWYSRVFGRPGEDNDEAEEES